MAINTNNVGLDFSDIKDTNDNILEIQPDKNQIKADQLASKAAIKAQEKQEKVFAKLQAKQEKESKSQSKERSKIKQEAGIDGTIDAQQSRMLIVRYRGSKKFAKFLKEAGFKLDDKTLNKLNEEELGDLLSKIQFAVCNKNSEHLFKTGIYRGLRCYEDIGERYLGLHITGLTAELTKTEEFEELLEELMLENQMMIYTKPYVRLLYSIVSTSYILHSAKSSFDALPSEQQQMIITELVKKSSNQTSTGLDVNGENRPTSYVGNSDALQERLEKKFNDLI